MKHYQISKYIIVILLLYTQTGCQKDFLDQKPDLSITTPSTLADCQVILDNYDRMNGSYPDHGEAAADNYYFTDASYDALYDYNVKIQESKANYIWDPKGEHVVQWGAPYAVVYSANLVLSVLEKLPIDDPNYKIIKGSALFYRAFAFYHLAQLFCKPYVTTTATTDLGIPLRLTPEPNEKSARGTVQQVYDRITQDLIEAIVLLPVEVKIKSRPSKAAAYAALARTYLAMEDYPKAGKMADECLKLQNTLIDYNETNEIPTATTVKSNSSGPSFTRFNAEVIFQSVTISGTLDPNIARIHPLLYNSYSTDDRRKSVFFGEGSDWMGNPNGVIGFRGNYDGTLNPVLFMGLATDEMYLIRAECYAHAGNTTLAMTDLNTLLAKRMMPPYINRTAANPNDALVQILTERRKELVFRTLRWTDLRRLNKDPQFAVTLRRDMNTITHSPLLPNDPRYTFLIPTKEVIELTDIEQNPR
ncbi:RagB/SusD family nutrient uptake outer membrane protein [Sphingobacterium sp. SRCM116780]|uniref:RagB/SusD family nutrient uptake outer membrane protein n=1 Tax=Sphingobacterium sp. SRCM116780 TaxID=2907623 RepID=UPI001F3AE03D|nr:RagB/SusD family nutrient uptake outer membrane protein [Sphingobacterium sp. SRCM116780]UIR57392.1 RagB/SusD family nutrient uptake outer membrane protein [Sphingobacterium sp. SRCM116780]